MNKRVYTYTYSEEYDPPMPVMEVGVSLPKQNAAEVTTLALLDSGSDLVVTLNGHAGVVEIME